jgi:lactosylceramide 4-alpha-galactosyltransferase
LTFGHRNKTKLIKKIKILAAGILKFQKDHPALDEMLQFMRNNFDGDDWGANGPGVVTEVLKSICSTTNLDEMLPEKCLGIKVFPPEIFYSVPWRQWKDYFDESKIDSVFEAIKESYSAHLWGRHSGHINLEDLIPAQPLYQLVYRHCPETFNIAFKHY